MIKLVSLQAFCPTCGSSDVFYTCHVTCCFNHVCNDCRTTFELATDVVGHKPAAEFSAPAERDTSLPTAPCASCEKANVFSSVEGLAACADCGALLTLRYEKVTRDTV